VQSIELKFLGVTVLLRLELPIFLLIFAWALQQVCSWLFDTLSVCWLSFCFFCIVMLIIVGPIVFYSLLHARLLYVYFFRKYRILNHVFSSLLGI